MKLKNNQVYVDKISGRIGILRWRRAIFADRRTYAWELDFGDSILPEELNPGFMIIIKDIYEYVGEL